MEETKKNSRNTHARPRPATKRHHESVERNTVRGLGVVEPALGDEFAGLGEDFFVVAEVGDAHGEAGSSWDGPLFVLDGFGVGAWVAGAQAVAESDGFLVGVNIDGCSMQGGRQFLTMMQAFR